MALKFDDTNSIIGVGSVFEGNFYIRGSLQISGKFEGEIQTEDHLMITESGKVKTNIIAKKVTVGGTLIGNIEAKEEVTILSTGQIMGNITSPILNLQKGAVHHGETQITGGQEGNVDKRIKESYSSVPGFEHYKKAENQKSNTKQKESKKNG